MRQAHQQDAAGAGQVSQAARQPVRAGEEEPGSRRAQAGQQRFPRAHGATPRGSGLGLGVRPVPVGQSGALRFAGVRPKNRLWLNGSKSTFPGTSEAWGRVLRFERFCRFSADDGLLRLWGRRDRFGLGEAFRASQIGVKGHRYEPVEADSQPFAAGSGLSVEGVGKS